MGVLATSAEHDARSSSQMCNGQQAPTPLQLAGKHQSMLIDPRTLLPARAGLP